MKGVPDGTRMTEALTKQGGEKMKQGNIEIPWRSWPSATHFIAFNFLFLILFTLPPTIHDPAASMLLLSTFLAVGAFSELPLLDDKTELGFIVRSCILDHSLWSLYSFSLSITSNLSLYLNIYSFSVPSHGRFVNGNG